MIVVFLIKSVFKCTKHLTSVFRYTIFVLSKAMKLASKTIKR